ncbi:FHA domain-containing protein [Archangium primigenium]|nr:FHA domain-containing protein [Archangium primigenium]
MSEKDTKLPPRRGGRQEAPSVMGTDDDMLAPSSDPDSIPPESESAGRSERTAVFRAPAHGERPSSEDEPPASEATVIRMAPERPPPKAEPPASEATVIRMAPERPPSKATPKVPARPSRSTESVHDKETLPPGSAALARSGPRAPVKAAKPASSAPVKASASGRALASRPSAPDAGSALSASDKARRRREAGETLGGQLSLWWGDMSAKGKSIVGLLVGGLLVGMLAALVIVFKPKIEQRFKGDEPVDLTVKVLKDSFGLGEGVDWNQPNEKEFTFDFVSPTRAVAVIRYHASGISKDEVSIAVNAVNVGWVPPDTVNTAEREVQLILTPGMLKRGEGNRVLFDNVRNPPGEDSWRIWNLRIEVIPVPNLPPQELLEAARTTARRARSYYDRRVVGPENLLLAWENYRSAWITLEALDEKPDLYDDVRHMLAEISVELDRKCGQLLLDFQRNIQFKDMTRAALVLEDINRTFPTPSHRCHNLSIEKANQYEL